MAAPAAAAGQLARRRHAQRARHAEAPLSRSDCTCAPPHVAPPRRGESTDRRSGLRCRQPASDSVLGVATVRLVRRRTCRRAALSRAEVIGCVRAAALRRRRRGLVCAALSAALQHMCEHAARAVYGIELGTCAAMWTALTQLLLAIRAPVHGRSSMRVCCCSASLANANDVVRRSLELSLRLIRSRSHSVSAYASTRRGPRRAFSRDLPFSSARLGHAAHTTLYTRTIQEVRAPLSGQRLAVGAGSRRFTRPRRRRAAPRATP